MNKHILILFLTMMMGFEINAWAEQPVQKESVVQEVKMVQSSKVVYACPMHPEVQQDHSGKCPKCGMELGILITNSKASDVAVAKSLTVDLKATKDGSTVSGTVRLEEVREGLKVSADIKGVLPGKYGFHIHENGSCADEGKAAGGHFNPDQAPHGLLTKDGFSHAHAGDMGNIEVNSDGTGKLEMILPGLSLTQGKYNVSGKAIILHEKEDNFGQPTGNAGGRVGCGIISQE